MTKWRKIRNAGFKRGFIISVIQLFKEEFARHPWRLVCYICKYPWWYSNIGYRYSSKYLWTYIKVKKLKLLIKHDRIVNRGNAIGANSTTKAYDEIFDEKGNLL